MFIVLFGVVSSKRIRQRSSVFQKRYEIKAKDHYQKSGSDHDHKKENRYQGKENSFRQSTITYPRTNRTRYDDAVSELSSVAKSFHVFFDSGL